jgi:hypothetical protein
MQILILIEPIEGDRYRARAGEPFALSAEGGTKLEAYRKLEEMIFQRLRAGGELFVLELSAADQGQLCAGSLKNHPLFDEWVAIMAENRRREDGEGP